jgi:fibro-slime domain-containing protein
MTIAGNYDPSWKNDPRLRNFSFTTESRSWFKYDSSKPLNLTFMSQDDMWVFVNKTLVVDMGGIHLPVRGDLTIANGDAVVSVSNTLPTEDVVKIMNAVSLGLTNGGVYEVAVFQAQRQTAGSSVQISLPALNRARSECSRE